MDTAKASGDKEVMSEVSEQTTAVARTAKDEFGQLATQTRQELKVQSEQRSEQLAARPADLGGADARRSPKAGSRRPVSCAAWSAMRSSGSSRTRHPCANVGRRA